MEQLLETLVSFATTTGIKILIAIILLIVSFQIINAISKRMQTSAAKQDKWDKTLTKTLFYVGKIILKCLVGICLVGYVGIDTSGITALIASLGVCAGLAVNGALANVAGGVLLLITRPFKIDDYIEVGEYQGTVEDIHLVHTKLRTIDNKVVYIANSTVSSSTVINYSEKEIRRVDHIISISYETDFEVAKAVIWQVLQSNPKVLQSPEPLVRMWAHNSSSIDLVCRVWVKTEAYWDVYFDLLEQIKQAFDAQGIPIPFNQLDVHVKQD